MKPNKAIIAQRAHELRMQQTSMEGVLWQQLRNRNVNGLKFRRQHPIGGYIVDFVCLKDKLIIEVDGDSHAEQEAYDAVRTQYLEGRGFRVVRFTNDEVRYSLDAVIEKIVTICLEKHKINSNSNPSPNLSPLDKLL